MFSSLGAGTGLGLLETAPSVRFRSRVLRPLLMAAGVAALLAAGTVWWLQGGRYVVVDDAYLRAAKLLVATDVSGIVARVNVHEGQSVHRGDILLELDARPFRIALEGAQAALAQTVLDVAAMKRDYQRAQRDIAVGSAQQQSDEEHYKRFSGLVHGGAVTQAETDDARFKLSADRQSVDGLRAQAQVLLARLGGDANIDPARTPACQQAQSKVDEAQRELGHTRLVAPFDGIVTQVESVQPGMYLGAASPAFALVSSEDVWAEGNPKETELTWVTPGDHVSVHIDSYPARSWNGTVESISPAAGSEFSVLPAQNTSGNWVKVVQRVPLRVRLEPQKDALKLRAGMSVTLDIDTGHTRHPADLLP